MSDCMGLLPRNWVAIGMVIGVALVAGYVLLVCWIEKLKGEGKSE